MHLRVIEVDPLSLDALTLLREAAMEARALYPEQNWPTDAWPTNEPTPSKGTYLIAYQNDEPVAMGAHRPIDSTSTEIRRLYTLANARRAGLARRVLHELEKHAINQGFTELKLETGNKQLPAIALYESLGFNKIVPFGPYQNDPTSICFSKCLTAGEA